MAELSQDAAITFDPSSGFSERDGKVWMTPWLDPQDWSASRHPKTIDARVYDREIPSDLGIEALLEIPCVAASEVNNPRPGWVALGLNNLKPNTQYSFILFAHYDQ